MLVLVLKSWLAARNAVETTLGESSRKCTFWLHRSAHAQQHRIMKICQVHSIRGRNCMKLCRVAKCGVFQFVCFVILKTASFSWYVFFIFRRYFSARPRHSLTGASWMSWMSRSSASLTWRPQARCHVESTAFDSAFLSLSKSFKEYLRQKCSWLMLIACLINSFELMFWPVLVCHLPYCSVLSKIGMVLHSVLFIEWFNCIVKDCFIKTESVCVCIEMKWCRLCPISVLKDVSFLFSHKNRLVDNITQFRGSFEEDEHPAIWSLEYRCIQYYTVHICIYLHLLTLSLGFCGSHKAALQMPMVGSANGGHRESAVLGPQTHRLPWQVMWGILAWTLCRFLESWTCCEGPALSDEGIGVDRGVFYQFIIVQYGSIWFNVANSWSAGRIQKCWQGRKTFCIFWDCINPENRWRQSISIK